VGGGGEGGEGGVEGMSGGVRVGGGGWGGGVGRGGGGVGEWGWGRKVGKGRWGFEHVGEALTYSCLLGLTVAELLIYRPWGSSRLETVAESN